MTNFGLIEVEIDEPNNIAIVFLNRPKQFNAFNIKLMEELIMVTFDGKGHLIESTVDKKGRNEKVDYFRANYESVLENFTL